MQSTQQADANPYIAQFVRSMSQEGEKKNKSGVKAGSSNPPPGARGGREQTSSSYVELVVDPTTSQSGEGAAVKRRRINGSGAAVKGYRRATGTSLTKLQTDLEAMKLSPETCENPYVERLTHALRQCYCRRHTKRTHTSSCPKRSQEAFHNQYVSGYHQRLLKKHCVCQASPPNCYVAQLQRR